MRIMLIDRILAVIRFNLLKVKLRTLTLTVSTLPLPRSVKLLTPLLTLRAGQALRATFFTPLALLLTVSTLLLMSCAKLLILLLTASTLSLLSYAMFDAYVNRHQHAHPRLDQRRCRFSARLICVIN
jgi:NADH:ubiquinone oxidoreductase subunit 2 (subunit N)